MTYPQNPTQTFDDLCGGAAASQKEGPDWTRIIGIGAGSLVLSVVAIAMAISSDDDLGIARRRTRCQQHGGRAAWTQPGRA